MYQQLTGKRIPDICAYVDQYVKLYPEVEIFIGTDSSVIKKNRVSYATAICFQKMKNGRGNGVHVIFERVIEDSSSQLFNRMWTETIKSEKIANQLLPVIKNFGKNLIIDCDVNPDINCGSNIAYDSTLGYLRGLGYTARAKPDAWAASTAADKRCN